MPKFDGSLPAQDGLGFVGRIYKHLADKLTLTPERSTDNVVQAQTATAVPFVVKRFSSGATADLIQVQDETGAVLSGFSSSGAALGGSISAIGDITISADTGSTGTGDIMFLTEGTEIAKFTNLATVAGGGGGLLLGNDHNSTYYAGTGGHGYNIPNRLQHVFGRTAGDVLGTTQGRADWTIYGQRTVDDSAESVSVGIILKDAYVGTFTQALPAVAFEADALAQGVTITNKLISFTAGLKIQAGTSHNSTVTTGIQFYGAIPTIDASQTLTNWYGIYLETPTVNGTLTNKWAFYAKDAVQTEGSLYIGVAGAQTSNLGVAMVTGPNVTGGASDIPTLVLRPGSGQTSASLRVDTNGGLTRFQVFGASGNVLMGNGATGGSGVGIISMVTTTAPSGTPPTAGAYLYVDPADNKLKAKTSGGTVTVLTPTA